MFVHNPAEVAYFVAGAAHFSSSWPKVKQNCDLRFERNASLFWSLIQMKVEMLDNLFCSRYLILEFFLFFSDSIAVSYFPQELCNKWNPVNFRWNACLQLSLSSLIQTLHASSAGWSAVRLRVTFPARLRSYPNGCKQDQMTAKQRTSNRWLFRLLHHYGAGQRLLVLFFVVTRESSW